MPSMNIFLFILLRDAPPQHQTLSDHAEQSRILKEYISVLNQLFFQFGYHRTCLPQQGLCARHTPPPVHQPGLSTNPWLVVIFDWLGDKGGGYNFCGAKEKFRLFFFPFGTLTTAVVSDPSHPGLRNLLSSCHIMHCIGSSEGLNSILFENLIPKMNWEIHCADTLPAGTYSACDRLWPPVGFLSRLWMNTEIDIQELSHQECGQIPSQIAASHSSNKS